MKGEGNSYITTHRLLDVRLGRWLIIDPLYKDFPWQTPYSSMDNNPLNTIDRTGGKGESTHVDDKGNVIAVINDGDKGVYQHGANADGGIPTEYMIKKRQEKWGTSAHGKKIGETKYWDEFIAPGTDKAVGKIDVGASWDKTIDFLNKWAVDYHDLRQIGNLSKANQPLDLKNRTKYAPDGQYTGRLLDGKYATARSAGNYLAGLNGRTATIYGMSISRTQYMMLAGSLQQGIYKKNSGYGNFCRHL